MRTSKVGWGSKIMWTSFKHPPPLKTFNFHRFDHIMQMSQKKVDPRLFRDESSRQSILCLLYSATCGDLTALKRWVGNFGPRLRDLEQMAGCCITQPMPDF